MAHFNGLVNTVEMHYRSACGHRTNSVMIGQRSTRAHIGSGIIIPVS